MERLCIRDQLRAVECDRWARGGWYTLIGATIANHSGQSGCAVYGSVLYG